jgi:manganese/zinc/iron transport system substrate-binding protein
MGGFPFMKHFLFGALLFGLASFGVLPGATAAERKLTVVCTTSLVADLVRQVGGARVEVQSLMGPGVDPHLYKATAADVRRLSRADVIFYSGLLLEGKMEDLFKGMARRKKRVVAVTDGIPRTALLNEAESQGHADPHVWFDLQLWSKCIDPVVRELSAADPEGKDFYKARAEQLRRSLEELHAWVLKRVEELPAPRRILVTSHDAYNYFGRAYGFQVVGLQGLSTVTEAGLADMAKLVDFIRKHEIKAVFVESSVPHNAIERISRDTGVKIGGELFSDALGTPGQMSGGYDLGTFEGMVRHNVNTIVNALK